MTQNKNLYIIEQIDKIEREYEALKKKFKPLSGFSVRYYDSQEGAKITKLYTKARALVSKYIGKESEYYKQIEQHSSRLGRSNLGLVIADLIALKEDLLSEVDLVEKKAKVKKKEISEKIFIVHGRDNEMKIAVARLIEQLNLVAVILHEQPSEGKTIIEKFEKHSDVGFAIVLLSPDDKGYSLEEGPKNIKFRARQNVILELGFFYGKLGRGRVVAIYKEIEDFEMPTDIAGVIYIPYDDKGKWMFDLIGELKICGYNVSKDDI
ncbi:hypothetical protein LCGC14_1843980 [marine sediment metagenome]|uniref:CD-NTase-associated protein 12/Pycsar effector protein TIR domain-containing protein n=1 Tax=marine sediment metagenome TaxID=412755 RepID=A0A0F9H0M3_9ZZZZ